MATNKAAKKAAPKKALTSVKANFVCSSKNNIPGGVLISFGVEQGKTVADQAVPSGSTSIVVRPDSPEADLFKAGTTYTFSISKA